MRQTTCAHWRSELKLIPMGIFGVPTLRNQAQLVLLPVPWEVTTSYGGGAALGPKTIEEASVQVDLFDLEYGEFYKKGIHLEESSEELQRLNHELKPLALNIRSEIETNGQVKSEDVLQRINQACQKMVDWVYQESKKVLAEGRILGIIGGDHSSPLGAIQAISERHEDFGVLHIDAHADLRDAYQGFTHSHASIMYNVMKLKKAPSRLVQVGIRDFCLEERNLMLHSEGRIKCFYDQQLRAKLFEGETWSEICGELIEALPEKVYVSFDIDGLSPDFCPDTGTPVPGGLSFSEATYLISELRRHREIIGFDLCEVSPGEPVNEWNGNVGARILFKLCGAILS